ncbi:MAG: RNA polymerase sporulation sigma factor SigK [Lachnospiraceae bacterium]|nr:RNA polymerase sporulation sigma factor SigK [Lachnospiraceae bacterium]
MKTFPKPLSSVEESFYFEKYKAGDEEAGNILVERNLRLVAHIAKKYLNAGEETEDLISIGTIGLIKAVSTFDNSKGNRLVTYAARCIDNELLMMLRSKKKTSKDVSLYEPIGMDKEGNEISLLDVTPDPCQDIIDAIELSDNIKRLKDYVEEELTDREKEIIKLRFGLLTGEEYTQREIGEKLGISRSYVSRIEKKAIQRLRECYEWEP